MEALGTCSYVCVGDWLSVNKLTNFFVSVKRVTTIRWSSLTTLLTASTLWSLLATPGNQWTSTKR